VRSFKPGKDCCVANYNFWRQTCISDKDHSADVPDANRRHVDGVDVVVLAKTQEENAWKDEAKQEKQALTASINIEI
jgi:hypothetical protein